MKRKSVLALTTVFIAFIAGPALASFMILKPHGPKGARWATDQEELRTFHPATLSITTPDGLKLHGDFLSLDPAQRRGVVVIVHGWGDYRLHHLAKARWALSEGMESLLFDLRASGDSRDEGWGTLGARETLDVHAAVQLAHELRPGAPVHLWGVSLGGFLVLNEAGRFGEVSSIVSESPFWSARQIMGQYLWLFAKLPYYPFGAVGAWTIEAVSGASLDDADLSPALPKLGTLPTLVIGSRGDPRMPPEHIERIFKAIPEGKKSMWIAPTAGHGRVFAEDPDEYETRVQGIWQEASALGGD